MRKIYTLVIFLAFGKIALAQVPVITDNLMMPKKDLAIGVFYGYDYWKNYWEGGLKRQNGNIGTVTTQSATLGLAYGLSNKVTLVAMIPYVWTSATRGTLHGMSGTQDITLSGKYNFFSKEYANSRLRFMALGMVSFPSTNYNVDLMPLSIGMGCVNVGGRLTADYSYKKWFVTGSGNYTWRSNVSLDRPAYYTNGHLFNTDEVKMPNTFDFIFRVGYKRDTWHVDVFYAQQNTLGGGDIERQNMPFVSNRMNFGKLGASTLVFIPQVKNLGVRLWGDYTITGRNVGQSTSIFGGLVYRVGPRSTAN